MSAVDPDRRAGSVDIAAAFDHAAEVDDEVPRAGDGAVIADEAALHAHVAGTEIERAAGGHLAVGGIVDADIRHTAAAYDQAALGAVERAAGVD